MRLRDPLRPLRLSMLALALSLGACATGELDSAEGDAAPAADAPAATTDVPTFDLVNPLDDVGSVDSGAPELDAGAPDGGTPELDTGTPDSGTPGTDTGTTAPDTGTPDTGAPDAGAPDVGGCASGETLCSTACVDLQHDARHCGSCGHACGEVEACTDGACTSTCAAPRMLCGSGAAMRCADLQSDAENCGSCGRACAAGGACMSGACAAAACMTNASDCNSNSADGCEVVHASALNTCPMAEDLGAFCGDTACGFLCGGRDLRVVATRTGNRSRWYRGRMNECSNCPASLNARITLRVPAGVDYDLYVYSACGRLIGSSVNLAGMTDQYVLTGGGSLGNDSADFYVEVRWFRGASCMPYTLTFEARSNAPNSC